MTVAAALLAVAVLIGGPAGRARLATVTAPIGRLNSRLHAKSDDDPLAAAEAFDVLAACLSAGMAVAAAAAATAPSAPPGLAGVLRRAADMLALGADPMTAWSSPDPTLDRHAEALLRLARRSAESGTALASGIAEQAAQSRADAADAARATAERASVLIAAPLGACYLPAFLCLGIVPVVAGLAGDLLGSGLW